MKDEESSFKLMIIFALILCFLTNCSALNTNTASDILSPENLPVANSNSEPIIEPIGIDIQINNGEIVHYKAYVIDNRFFVADGIPRALLANLLILKSEDNDHKEIAKAVFLYHDKKTEYSIFILDGKVNNTSENKVPEKVKELVGEIKDAFYSEIFKYKSEDINSRLQDAKNGI